MGTLDWMEFNRRELDRQEQPGVAAAPFPAAASAWTAWPEADFAALFRQHYARLVSVAARLVGERAQAEEIADDAFWKLYRQPRLQAPGNNVAGWLYRTVSRLALDRIRSRKRADASQQRWQSELTLAGPQAGPLRALELRQEADRVRRTLARLKPLQAQLLLLRYSDFSYQDLAAALQLNPASVGTMLARAETAFATLYAKEAV